VKKARQLFITAGLAALLALVVLVPSTGAQQPTCQPGQTDSDYCTTLAFAVKIQSVRVTKDKVTFTLTCRTFPCTIQLRSRVTWLTVKTDGGMGGRVKTAIGDQSASRRDRDSTVVLKALRTFAGPSRPAGVKVTMSFDKTFQDRLKTSLKQKKRPSAKFNISAKSIDGSRQTSRIYKQVYLK